MGTKIISKLPWIAIVFFGVHTTLIAQGTRSEWPDEVANDVVAPYMAGLEHGPMLRQPTAHSMRVWIKTDTAKDFEVLYSRER